jgi:hypothetical protein
MSEIDKIASIIEEDGSGCFLIITSITGIENLNSNFSILIGMLWRYCIAILIFIYPVAPVPKSIAITWVNELSYFNSAIFQIITVDFFIIFDLLLTITLNLKKN